MKFPSALSLLPILRASPHTKRIAFTFVSLSLASVLPASQWGSFSGNPQVELLPERQIRLLEEFTFRDPAGTIWLCEQGWIVDGASIPKPFWSFIGGPLEGAYRNASIIHDYACDNRTRGWRQTHRAFYEAMRCGGVSVVKAKLMYYAVYHFGPRWGISNAIRGIIPKGLGGRGGEHRDDIRWLEESMTEEQLEQIAEFIAENDPTLSELEKLKIENR